MVRGMVKELNPSSDKHASNGTTGNHGNTHKKQYLNFGEDTQMEIAGYVKNKTKTSIIWIIYGLTLGLVRLIFHWYPQWEIYLTHNECPLGKAEKVVITDKYKDKVKSYFVKNVEILKANSTDNVLERTESIISINGLIFAKNSNKNLLTIHLCDGSEKKLEEVRVVHCKKLTYVWDPEKQKFIKLAGLDKGVLNSELHQHQGFTKEEQKLRSITYGTNEINVPVQSIITLLVLEALTPFYIFQVFSLVVWLAEYYYYYTIAIIVMSVFGISTSIIQTRKNQQNLKGTVQSADKIMVSRGGDHLEEVPTTELVPGDLIVVPAHGCIMQCDAVLLNGNCIVNESMLTGESVPVTKTALPNNQQYYDVKEHGNHTLFCGTKVIQTRYYGTQHVLAVVVRTGYLTTKGQLVRSILYPPPVDFRFDQDSYKFIMILSVIAFFGFIYTIFSKYSRNVNGIDILIKALDLVTIAIPPALPATMTVGKLYALSRLKKYQIFCVNSRVINVSGSINCICFDKTGTLTEDGLDLWGVVPVNQKTERSAIELGYHSKLFQGMLTCHSLTLIDGELSGDPLDVKMFESTGWVLEELDVPDTFKYDLIVPTIVKDPLDSSKEFGLIQQYQFSSTLQRMSVICRRLGSDSFEIFTKGSPEMVITLSRPETVPNGILDELKIYTRQGYRVIGMGTRTISNIPFHKIPKMQREQVECDLEFIGLIVLENRLKPQTANVISTLKQAGMKVIMITGDNIETAVSVARDCGIIQSDQRIIDVITTKPTKLDVAKIKYQECDGHTPTTSQTTTTTTTDIENSSYQLVLNGTTWADLHQYFPHLIPRIVTRGVVFARMSGLQKQQLIEQLQNLGYYVAMCGDGANDCGALKAANVGISLSEAESSVASSFTSQQANISCVTQIIKEGRAALLTSFGVFKLMLCYSLTEFTSVIILYAIDTNLTSLQFLFIDICLILNFASFFGKTKAYQSLHHTPPMTSLLGFIPLSSIVLFMVITVLVQIFAYYIIQTFDWFTPFHFDHLQPTNFRCYENYAVYSVSMFQYIIMAIVFAKGKPYRQPLYTNYLFTFAIFLMIVICSYITLDPAEWIAEALELKLPPFYNGRLAILIIALINFIICLIVEEVIVDYVLLKFVRPKFRKVERSRQKYLKIEQDLKNNTSWPNCHKNTVTFNEINENGGGLVNKGFNGTIETTQC